MDQSEQQGNDQTAAEASVTTQAPEAQAAPARAPRKRRTASAPAGAPPSATQVMPDAGTAADTAAGAAAPTEITTDTPAETAAPVRKRAPRVRKPVVVTDQTTSPGITADAGEATPAAADDAPAAPARAPRTRRRAASAEAGPAGVASAPVEPVAVPAVGKTAEPAAIEPADAVDTSTGTASPAAGDPAEAPAAPARASRTRRRAASAEAGPAGAVDTAVDSAIGQAAPVAADAPAVDAEAAAETAVEEKPVRARRTSARTRSRRASEPPQQDEQAGIDPAAAEPSATSGAAARAADTADDTARGSVDAAEDAESGETPDGGRLDPFAIPESPLSLLFHAPDLTTVSVPSVKVAPPREEEAGEDETEESGRRSRRSRRSRGRGRGDSGQAEAATEDADSPDDQPDGNGPEEGASVTSRRRRRRRRGDQDLELTGGEDDDPPNTVTRVRAPRQASEPVSDRVTSVRGSTRLEAKKQRRRESRDTGRRRTVITEAEFLARRESVDRQMIVRQSDDRIQIGVLEDGMLAEHFVSRTQQDSLIGNVYVGKVQNVLPSMEAAFVDIGRGRNAVLYAGEVNWDAAGLDGQPRRIELALKSGDPVLVQVTKDPVGHKGARLTSQISLPGRYLVYVPGGSMTGISRKLPDVERNRLKRILKDRLPESAGVIVRTAAEGASEEELTHDINRLRAQWEEIERKAGSTKTLAPELLYGEPDLTIKVVRDVFNEDFSKLVVSGEDAWDTIEAYVMYVAPDLVGRLEKWTSEEDIFAASRIDEQISKALERKVYLPSGGSLVIDRTEAMTVVDVNTGKFTGSGGNLEETVTKNNLEAAEEVVRQLRLRDIGGIIVIDFIDMVLEANRDLVLRRLVECLGRDRTKHQVAEVTSLGLVQMTRKRMGTGLLEVFGEDCEHCAGRGVVTYMEPVEHRRSTTAESQQQPRQDKPSRSERKRNRGRGGPQDEGLALPPVPVAESPDRAAKAEAARAALASIAAATHHAHEEASEQEVPASDVQVTEAVLTINGETVTLPRADGRRPAVEEAVEAPATRLTLDSLSEAFNRKPAAAGGSEEPSGPVPAETPRTDPTTAPAVVSGPPSDGTPARASRPRRRVARSAQGAADTAIETQGAEPAVEPAGTRHVAKAAAPARTPDASAAEPLIFGVGVPASEL
ncbi:Rne/Rng family ribonuclease [Arthrobacter sp. SX1312]|uniref:Rne/Rng family ribonuclease n=1 Tax=Arthrobacter sp. SX1312 TaxID=2058896 RepID=UPI00215726C4|nr:Rne/Rng family ribonuclease [Arthrobacter sp. SX1312]